MGDFTKTVLKTDPANDLAAAADQWWRRGSSKVKCIDVSLTSTGDSWKKAYDNVSKLLTGSVKKNADGRAQGLQQLLNTWSGARKDDADLVKNIKQWFSGLLDELKGTPLYGGTKQAQQDVDNFRSTGFSVMMAVSAGYESAKTNQDHDTTFKKVKLTTRCDSVHDRFGDPPMDWRIDRSEPADRYWQAKAPKVAPDSPTQIGTDLGTLASTNTDPKIVAAAFDSLTTNLDSLTDSQSEQKGVAAMFFVEAVRKPLGFLRGPGEQPNAGKPKNGEWMSRILSDQQVKDLEKVAEANFTEWRKEEAREKT
jgi:hypothetical protein